MSNTDPLKLREIILNTRTPLVLKNSQHKWPCFQDGLEEWCKLYDDLNVKKPNFEEISKKDSHEPQWERKRQLVEMSAIEFLSKHSKDCEYWSGLNYKRKHEFPVECTSGIDFTCFGFSQAAEDCTLWLSSTGANTPCHYDSYGCNIVVQVYGRKSWLMFPPETSLTTSRIPYEESSVYCLENFYAPNINVKSSFEKFKKQAYQIILEPNDVLIVPKHWWHYVEALETSLSVNAWIPLEKDANQQMEECIVKYLIESFFKDSSATKKEYIMNPNQLLAISSSEELFSIMNFLFEESCVQNSPAKKLVNLFKYQYLSEEDVNELLKDVGGFFAVSLMSDMEFDNFIDANSLRYCEVSGKECNDSPLCLIQEVLINSICSPFIVESIKKEFYKRYKIRK